MQSLTLRRCGLLALYALLLGGGWLIGRELQDLALIDVRPSNEPAMHAMLMMTIAVFVLASALPFVPGAEIGLALMLVFGGRMALLVYASMVLALLAAFTVGRLVPLPALASALRRVGLQRAHHLVTSLGDDSPAQWAQVLAQRAPTRVVPFLLTHRYCALALLLNLPGNSLVGGGGGIALTAGLSRLFSFPAYLATILLAVMPVPLGFLLLA